MLLRDAFREEVHCLQAVRKLATVSIRIDQCDPDALAEGREDGKKDHRVETGEAHSPGLVAEVRRVLPAQRPEFPAQPPPLDPVRTEDDAHFGLLEEDEYDERDG